MPLFSFQCMTPPHSPSFAEMSTTNTALQSSSSLAVSSQRCGSGLHQPVLAPIAEKTSSLPPLPQPCRAMATSVIRHTADSISCQHHIPVAPKSEKTRETLTATTVCQKQQQKQYMTKTEQIITPPSPPASLTTSKTEQQSSLSKPCLDSVSTSTTVTQPQNSPPTPPVPTALSPPSVNSPQIICHMFPVSSQPGIISAFIPSTVPTSSTGIRTTTTPILPQPTSANTAPVQQSLIVGSAVPQGTVMLVVPQSSVSQAPHCPQTVMTLGNTKLLPLAPAPVYMPAGPSSNTTTAKMDFSRRRNYVCNFAGCRKTYFKSSHLKAHLRTHTGEHLQESLVQLLIREIILHPLSKTFFPWTSYSWRENSELIVLLETSFYDSIVTHLLTPYSSCFPLLSTLRWKAFQLQLGRLW